MRAPRVASAICLAAVAAALAPGGRGAGGPAAAARDAPFFRYLLGSPEPALVAFNPSTFDPRKKNRGVDSAASVREDLAALRPAFDGLVFYSYDKETTPLVVREAIRQRYRAVLLAVWDVTSEEEIKGVAELAAKHADQIAVAIAVGNEGVNFNRYTPEQLEAAGKRVTELLGKNRVRVPLTTCEPFGQYGQEAVTGFGDFLAPNIHPVFDRKDLGAAEAAAYTRERAVALAESAGKPCLVHETGFPHGGDERRFDPEKQKQFWAAYLKEGRLARLPNQPGVWVSFAAAFEAFDMPWKAAETKIPIEAHWGLLGSDRTPYPAFSVWKALQQRTAPPGSPGLALRTREVHAYVVEQMDLWTGGTVVVDERESGGAAFYPTNRAGDVEDLEVEEGCTKRPARGTSYVAVTYRPRGAKGWAAVTWAYPDRPGPNWGEAKGRDLTGATALRGFIRGAKGGEIVELSVGGVNREPRNDPAKPHQDPFGPVTVRRKLGTDWEEFEIALPRGASLEGVIGGFTCAFSKALNEEGAAVHLDEVRFDDASPDQRRLVRSYVPTADPRDDAIRNGAFLYDNDLLLLYLLSRDDADAGRRAAILADSIVDSQTHDRAYADGRFRNAPACGPLIDPASNTARLPGIYSREKKQMLEDRYTVSTDAGNMGWTVIALVSAHAKLEAGKKQLPHRYLNAARRAGRWLEEHCRVNDTLGGYSGGYEGWERTAENKADPAKLEWRSVEHNLDLAVAFQKLAAVTAGEESRQWAERADHAKRFVFRMWNPKGNHFWVGVRDRKETLNEDAVPADVHTWAVLALGHDPAFRTLIGWAGPGRVPGVVDWVEAKCREEAAGRTGYRFSDKGKGIWPEGCAHLAACYYYLGEQKRAEAVLEELLNVSPPGKADGTVVRPAGIPAAYPEVAETGFIKEFAPGVVDKWTYPARPHLGASAWFLLAARGANPYWLEGPPAGGR